MARTFYIGNIAGSNAGFTIRQSRPGTDAAFADFDNLLFDANMIPGAIVGSGITGFLTAGNWNQNPQSSKLITVAHGIGHSPTLIMATAQPMDFTTGTSPFNWRMMILNKTNNNASKQQDLNQPTMDFNFCTPFHIQGDDGTNTFRDGWGYTWDSANLNIYNGTPNLIRVAWMAMDF